MAVHQMSHRIETPCPMCKRTVFTYVYLDFLGNIVNVHTPRVYGHTCLDRNVRAYALVKDRAIGIMKANRHCGVTRLGDTTLIELKRQRRA